MCAICWDGFINQVEQVKNVIDHIQTRVPAGQMGELMNILRPVEGV